MVQLTEHHGLLLWKNNMDNITITEKAKERLVSLMQDDKTNLELSVLGGGCSGMSYSLKYTDREPTNNDKIYYFGEYPSILKMIVPFASYVYLIGTGILFIYGLYIFTRVFKLYESRELINSNLNTIYLQIFFGLFYALILNNFLI